MSSTTAAKPRSSKDIDFHVDPDAPLFVAGAVIGSAFLGGTAGAVFGVVRGVSPIHFAVATAARCGIFGLALFGSREYLVSPILVGLRATPGHALRADEAAGKPVQLTMGEVRMQRVLDSAIAAALAGGGLSFGMRGPRTTLPAAFTAALIASVAQFSVNEVRVWRLKHLASKAREAAPAIVAEGDDLPPLPTVAEALEDNIKAPGARRGDSPLTQRVLDKLTAVLPIQKISDDDFLATMEKRRGVIEQRLKEIDQEQLALFERSSDKE